MHMHGYFTLAYKYTHQ